MTSDYAPRPFPFEAGFSVIEKWTDMAPFAGKIVAVDSPSFRFAQTFLGHSEAFYATCSTLSYMSLNLVKSIAVRLLSDYNPYSNIMAPRFWVPAKATSLKAALDTLDGGAESCIKLKEKIIAYYPEVRSKL